MSHESRRMTIRGTRLHVEIAGPTDAPALVYLHGGPGASCYDFVTFQMPLLARSFRVIALDQRGVLRSDPIGADEAFGLEDLVRDCEALRMALGLRQWTVLGHSFGGHLAVRYASSHPESVRAVVLENPSFDLGLSLRSHLRAMGMVWLEDGDRERAAAAWSTALGAGPVRDILTAFLALQQELGGQRWEAMHMHEEENREVFLRLWENAGFPPSLHRRSEDHAMRLLFGGALDASIVPLLDAITQPCLLMKGKDDLVTTEGQILAFLARVQDGEVSVFARSGHFPRIEEPERYAAVVRDFALRHALFA